MKRLLEDIAITSFCSALLGLAVLVNSDRANMPPLVAKPHAQPAPPEPVGLPGTALYCTERFTEDTRQLLFDRCLSQHGMPWFDKWRSTGTSSLSRIGCTIPWSGGPLWSVEPKDLPQNLRSNTVIVDDGPGRTIIYEAELKRP